MRARALLVLSALLVLPACGTSSTDVELPGTAPAIEGPIVARDVPIAIADGEPPTIHVKEGEDDPCGIIFALDQETDIARRNAIGDLLEGSVDDLTVGTRVRVWARGAIAESCPAQGRADAVEILGG